MDSEAVIRAGQATGEPKTKGTADYALVPHETELKSLEEFGDVPKRARAEVTAEDVTSLCAYINRFKTDATAIFAELAAFRVVGIVDYHAPTAPAFRQHRASYAAPRAKEWVAWRQASGKKMAQVEFAQFIEDNQVDIAFPSGAEVLEVSRNLSAHKAVQFVSSISLSDGSRQLTYNETVDGATSRGNIKVPEEFVLGIPVFFGGPKYDVRARLRYRIEGGTLAMWFDLYRPEYIEQDAFQSTVSEIATATGITPYMGKP